MTAPGGLLVRHGHLDRVGDGVADGHADRIGGGAVLADGPAVARHLDLLVAPHAFRLDDRDAQGPPLRVLRVELHDVRVAGFRADHDRVARAVRDVVEALGGHVDRQRGPGGRQVRAALDGGRLPSGLGQGLADVAQLPGLGVHLDVGDVARVIIAVHLADVVGRAWIVRVGDADRVGRPRVRRRVAAHAETADPRAVQDLVRVRADPVHVERVAGPGLLRLRPAM